MKCLVKFSLVAALSIAAVSSYPQSEASGFDYLCINVVTGVLQHPDNCHQYIQCDRFFAEVMTCPEGQIFSTQVIECVIGDQATCTEGVLEVEPEVSCEAGYSGRMACPGDCGKYYNCADGSAQLESCLEGYIYYEPFRICLPGYDDQGTCRLHSAGK